MVRTHECARLLIVTGGPGSGKTTLVAALADQGIAHMEEAGRAIIRDQLAIGGSALPWVNRLAFAEQMLGWELRSYRMAQQLTGTVLFDRGVPDVAGYLQLIGESVPDHVTRAVRLLRYNPQVFIAPPWRAIFAHDSERRQSWAEAVRTYEVMAKTYESFGYSLVQLPLASVPDRVAFVLDHLRRLGPTDTPDA